MSFACKDVRDMTGFSIQRGREGNKEDSKVYVFDILTAEQAQKKYGRL
ncbi:MAG: hypothetical protein R6U61_03310 [Thermoplasmata archaeon]